MEAKCSKSVVVLVLMALSATLGVVLLFVGCAVPVYTTVPEGTLNWWGIFVLLFYFLSPVPLAIARLFKHYEVFEEENMRLVYEICYFLSACVVVSGFGLPVVLARRLIIDAVSAGIISAANTFVFSTVFTYFAFFGREEEWDWMNDGL